MKNIICIIIGMGIATTLQFSMLKGETNSFTIDYETIRREDLEDIINDLTEAREEVKRLNAIVNTFNRGDLNEDGTVDASDASLLLTYYACSSVDNNTFQYTRNFNEFNSLLKQMED